MNNKKQSAVEWLIDKIVQDQLHRDIPHKVWLEHFEKAKELEKQQIVDAVNSQRQLGWDEKGEQYYNETYEK